MFPIAVPSNGREDKFKSAQYITDFVAAGLRQVTTQRFLMNFDLWLHTLTDAAMK